MSNICGVRIREKLVNSDKAKKGSYQKVSDLEIIRQKVREAFMDFVWLEKMNT